MERLLLDSLMKWRDNPHRMPLLLRGPRQVGKTWLLKEFGAEAYENVVYVNFETEHQIAELFKTSKDVHRIIEHLSTSTGTPIRPGEALLIFDEIQQCSEALTALKYFNENAPDIHVVAAGSLLGVALARPGSFPVGKVEFLDLYPLTFTEFLIAAGDTHLVQYLNELTAFESIPEILFRQLSERLAWYLVVGGMPAAVMRWLENRDLDAVSTTQQSILDSYRLDVARHAPGAEVPRIGHVWDSIPYQLSKENRKFVYKAAREGARAREYENAIHWLVETRSVTRVSACTAPRLPLPAYGDAAAFKLYMYDTGLLSRHSRLDYSVLTNPHAAFTEFKGALTENYVLQALIAQFEGQPCYWTSSGEAEVEFVLQRKNDIHPIEVKSGVNVKSKSLGVYRRTYSPRIAVRLSLRNLQFRDGLLDVPLFMADHLDRLIQLALESVG